MIRTITPQQLEHAKLLERIAEALDLTPTQQTLAHSRYKSVGNHLQSSTGSLAGYSPSVYTQGSFRLGTVIRPLNDEDVFDIDLVCELEMDKATCTQAQVKSKVGDRLSTHPDYDAEKEPEKPRCFRLDYYESGSKFHMDVVPAVPDSLIRKYLLEEAQLAAPLADGAVSITDSKCPDFDRLNGEWPTGNPKGYAEWFKTCMQKQFDTIRKSIMLTESFASIEAVPTYRVKTPLQRAVQLLKRHRDNMFGDDKERPTSIIITTLAAHGYVETQEGNLYHALFDILDTMPRYIQHRADGYWVENPVYPKENLADCWNTDDGKRCEKFEQWRQRAMHDLKEAFVQQGLMSIASGLSKAFGDGSVKSAVKGFGAELNQMREEKRLLYERGSAMIGTAAGKEKVSPHSFHQNAEE